MKLTKRRVLILCAAVVVAVVGTVCGVQAKKAHDERVVEEALQRETQRVAEEIVRPVAESLGISDLVFDHTEDAVGILGFFSSETFDALDDEGKLDFLVEVEKRLYLEEYEFPFFYGIESGNFSTSGEFFELRMVSGGDKYWCSSGDGMVNLVKGQERVLSKRGYIASPDYHQGSGSGSGTCPLCNGSGVFGYQYGSSDFEALLDGQPATSYGRCPRCGGTGRVQ